MLSYYIRKRALNRVANFILAEKRVLSRLYVQKVEKWICLDGYGLVCFQNQDLQDFWDWDDAGYRFHPRL